METKFFVAGILGGIANYIAGFLVFGLALSGYLRSHVGAEGAMKAEPDMLGIILGCLVFGFLISLIFSRWAGIKTAATGAKAGAIIAFLASLAHKLWAHAELYEFDNYIPVIVYALGSAIEGAAVGAVVGWWLGRE